jgi:D-lactate dehydrogenase
MTEVSSTPDLIAELKDIVGSSYIYTDEARKLPYCKGFRFGEGGALAVIKPGSLLEIWQALKACHDADVIIIMQAANTGLTGGSTPDGHDYDRPIVIISTLRIDSIQLIHNAKQIVAFAGSTLFGLEDKLAPHGREPHSVIGSSCIGASIVGGVCNNSGGALVQRGPAYTELSLFAQVNAAGELTLVNNLGIDLGQTPEEILTTLESQSYGDKDIHFPEGKLASDNEYHQRVREVDADTPSRFNNDARRLHDASGCAGKLAVFAVRLDTYPKPEKERVFYVGVNDPDLMTKIRRDILSTFKHLPVSGEYYDSACYDVSKKYGKDSFVVIDKLGSNMIPKLFGMKRYVDRMAGKFAFLPDAFSDRMMQVFNFIWPNHLPKRMEDFRKRYKLHFIVETRNEGADEAQAYFEKLLPNAQGDFFVCTESEAKKAMLQRFAIGGGIGRFFTLNKKTTGPLMTIDVALRRNEKEWLRELPPELAEKVEHEFNYGHFFCHVMHHNYIMKSGVDAKAVKQQILASFDARGAEYPAEHNVGHEYAAKDTLKAFYKKCDPVNVFNPGIGKTSKAKHWS